MIRWNRRCRPASLFLALSLAGSAAAVPAAAAPAAPAPQAPQQPAPGTSASQPGKTPGKPPGPAPLKALTEPAIQAVLADLRRAASARDVEGVLRHYAGRCVLTATAEPRDGGGEIRMTRDEFRKHLTQFFGGVAGYAIEHEKVQIAIAADGKTARVRESLVEQTVMGEVKVKTESPEELTFELIDGRPQIVVSKSLPVEKPKR